MDGDIGDDDPVQAMEDGLRRFQADEVIISTHPPGRSNWLERDVVRARPRARSTIEVTHVVVDLDREGVGTGARLLDRQGALHAGLLVARHGAVELVAAGLQGRR